MWKEFLLTIGIEALIPVLSALVSTSGLGPKFKAACEAALTAVQQVLVAAETPNV
jgi:hypothetical protein